MPQAVFSTRGEPFVMLGRGVVGAYFIDLY